MVSNMSTATRFYLGLLFGLAALSAASPAWSQNDATGAIPVVIQIDTAAGRHPISPFVYGVCFGNKDQLTLLNCPINRYGGNGATAYNWQNNSSNHANDWFFESIAEQSPVPALSIDSLVKDSLAAGCSPMVTIPMIGWASKLGPNRETLPSFSVAKYGPQQKADPGHPDFGNGMLPDGKTPIFGNDPNDDYVKVGPDFEAGLVHHLLSSWGTSTHGGVRWYIMDNEPSLWNSTHRDIHPQGDSMDEILSDIITYGTMVKEIDPHALIAAPEEWGWPGYFYSGADRAYAAAHNNQGHPDKDAHGGQDFYPWLLGQIRQHDQATGSRLLDMITAHIYPQGGEFTNDVSPAMVDLRNRSTRALWDPNYKDESWIKDYVNLIPRMKNWVAQNYPGTKIGITEYNWGADNDISGATAEADLLGIFGREGVDVATRWTCPDASTPTFKAIQLYRNYDGRNSTFGNVSVPDVVPDPDTVSSFAGVRTSDHALTVIVINKSRTAPAAASIVLANYPAKSFQTWQLTSTNVINQLPESGVIGNQVTTVLPTQSITLFVFARLNVP
jgi:hypothetical protein